ncbi:hypothetical protein ACFQX8_18615 [Klenkia terrae]|uniref:hypothetical protein n=1 Tax=Klenkia terrae TaxID=1052259 RepID=UPI00360FA22D
MDYDDYGSNAVELAVDLANADRDDPAWAAAFVAAHHEWFTEGTALELTPVQSRPWRPPVTWCARSPSPTRRPR